MIREAKTCDDVVVFINEIIAEEVAIHTDNDFVETINAETEQHAYTPSRDELRNSLMSQCFEVCR